jgi:serine/threonine protein kinase
MDFIDGEDLRERLDRVDFIPEEEVVTIGATICDALTYLHTREQVVLHRDIKPGISKSPLQDNPFWLILVWPKVTQPG